jgi:hypothetical protein
MTAGTRNSSQGRHLFGAAALAFGIATLIRHDYRDLGQLRSLLNAADGPFVVYIVAAALIVGGAAIQLRRTSKTGAAVLGGLYLLFALLAVPPIVAAPRIYNNEGNFFEQFSLLTGALLVYGHRQEIGRVFLGLCAGSFALEQAFYLKTTADLVPKWIPPGPMFWATATTVFFALAAVALLANRRALLAARLLAIMVGSFGVLVWIPMLVAQPGSYANWSETAETFAIAATAWILAEILGERRG